MSDILWPNGSTKRPYVTSPFGPRNINVPNASKNHKGADMVGFAVIHAVADGQVRFAGTPNGWSGGGIQAWVQHDGFFSKSLHSSALLVRDRQWVRAGDPLCVMGMTGTASDRHLHLEITPGTVHFSNSGQVDPVAFLAARISGTPAGSGSAPAPAVPTVWKDDMAVLVTGGGQNLILGDKLIPLTPADVAAIKGAQVLEVTPSTHYNIIQAFSRDGVNAALPVIVYVKDGNGTVYLLTNGKLEALVDPSTLAALHAQGAASVTLSQAEVTNLLAG